MRDKQNKVVFVFPGQGSQYVGMGKEIYDNYAIGRKVFNKADEVLKTNLSEICFQGPEETLKLTVNTQPAILTVSNAILNILSEENIAPDFVAGHSLGEYSALIAAESISFADAVWLVRNRGQYMQDAVPPGGGTMAAIVGLGKEKVEEICLEAGGYGQVEPANYNSPSQIVIAGKIAAVQKAVELAKTAGAKMAVVLQVSGPFHSSLLKPAADHLKKDIAGLAIKKARIPIIANINALPGDEPETIRNNLIEQVYRPVLWYQTIEKLVSLGATTFVEIGPGKVLSGLIKKIDKNIETYNIENVSTLQAVVTFLKGAQH